MLEFSKFYKEIDDLLLKNREKARTNDFEKFLETSNPFLDLNDGNTIWERNVLILEALPFLKSLCREINLEFNLIDLSLFNTGDSNENLLEDLSRDQISKCFKNNIFGPSFVAIFTDNDMYEVDLKFLNDLEVAQSFVTEENQCAIFRRSYLTSNFNSVVSLPSTVKDFIQALADFGSYQKTFVIKGNYTNVKPNKKNFTINFDPSTSSNGKYLNEFLQQFVDFVGSSIVIKLKKFLLKEYNTMDTNEKFIYLKLLYPNFANLKMENFLHRQKTALLNAKSEYFIHDDFENIFLAIHTDLNSSDDKLSTNLIVISGPTGVGKSTLLSQLHERVLKSIPQAKVVIRYVGLTMHCDNARSLISSIIEEIDYHYMDLEKPSIFFSSRFGEDEGSEVNLRKHEFVDLIKIFKSTLAKASKDSPLIILIDGLENLTNEYLGHLLTWLPLILPLYCKIIVSVADSSKCKPFQILSQTKNFVKENNDNRSENNLIETKNEVENVDNFNFKFISIDTIIKDMFEFIELECGAELTRRSVAYISFAKRGLTYSELEDILSCDEAVLKAVLQETNSVVQKISSFFLTNLLSNLKFFIHYIFKDGLLVFAWKNQKIAEIVQELYLNNPARNDAIHAGLATYFKGKWAHRAKPYRDKFGNVKEVKRSVLEQPWFISYWLKDKSSQPDVCHRQFFMQNYLKPNKRKSVLPYHELLSGRLSDAIQTFLNFDAMESAFIAGLENEILLMYDLAVELHGEQMLQFEDLSEESTEDPLNTQSPSRLSSTPKRIASVVWSKFSGVLKKFSKWEMLNDFREFVKNEKKFLSKYPQHLLQHAANQPIRSSISVIARKVLELEKISNFQEKISWLDWLNRPEFIMRPSAEYLSNGNVESVDAAANKIVTAAKSIPNELNFVESLKEQNSVSVRIFDKLSCIEVAVANFPLEGNLSRVKYSLAGDRVAFSDGLVLRFLDGDTLNSLTSPVWAHSQFYEHLSPAFLTIGILLLQWFDGDAKLATASGVYDESIFGDAYIPAFDCEILIWDTVHFTKLKVVHSYQNSIPISSSPSVITFRPGINTRGRIFFVDLEEEEVKFGIFPDEAVTVLENFSDMDEVDLIDLSVFWPNVLQDYEEFKEGVLFESICSSVTCGLSGHTPNAVIWDPVAGLYLISITGSLNLNNLNYISVLGNIPLSQLALETQKNLPMIGLPGGKGFWSVKISADGCHIALPIDNEKIGIWSVPNVESKSSRNKVPILERTQTVDGNGDFLFTADGNYLITTTIGIGAVQLWRVDKTNLIEDWRPLQSSIDAKFLASRGPVGEGRKEIAVLDISGNLLVADLCLKTVYWKERPDPSKRKDEIVYLVATHPLLPIIATCTTKCRIHLWIYDFTELNASYIQNFIETAPGTRIVDIQFAPFSTETVEGFVEVALAHQSGEITVWKTTLVTRPTLTDAFGRKYQERGINCVMKYSVSGEYLICVMSDNIMYVRRKGSQKILETKLGLNLYPFEKDIFKRDEGNPTLCVGHSHEELVIVASNKSETVKFCNLSEWKVKEIKVGGVIKNISFTLDDTMALVAYQNATVKLWDLTSSECLCTYVLDLITPHSFKTSLVSALSEVQFALDENLILVKAKQLPKEVNNLFVFEVKNTSQFQSTKDPRLCGNWTSVYPSYWSVPFKFIEHVVLRRDLSMLHILRNAADSLQMNLPTLLAKCIQACLRYHDVSQFDESAALFAEPWFSGIDILLELDANVYSEPSRKVLLLAFGLNSKIVLTNLRNHGVPIESDALLIHNLFMECLTDWYDELPSGRRSFISKILSVTGAAGLEAITYNQDALLCKAAYEGQSDVVSLCIDYRADVHVNFETPILNALATENKDVVDILRKAGVSSNVKVDNVFKWMKNHLEFNDFKFSAISKIKVLVSQLYGNLGKRALLLNKGEIIRLLVENNDLAEFSGLVVAVGLDLREISLELLNAAYNGKDAKNIVEWLEQEYDIKKSNTVEKLHTFTSASIEPLQDVEGCIHKKVETLKVENGLSVKFLAETSEMKWCGSSVPLSSWLPLTVGDGDFSYFELMVEYLEHGTVSLISIGLAGSIDTHPVKVTYNSLGYITVEKTSLTATKVLKTVNLEMTFSSRDLIGCGYEFGTGKVFFTMNGNIVGSTKVDESNTYHAVVGCNCNSHLAVNVGQNPFRFSKALEAQTKRFLKEKAKYSCNLKLEELFLENMLVGNTKLIESLKPNTLNLPPRRLHKEFCKRVEISPRMSRFDLQLKKLLSTVESARLALKFDNSSILRLASSLGRWDIVELCIKEGCDVSYNNFEAGLLGIIAFNIDNVEEKFRSTLFNLLPEQWEPFSVFTFLLKVVSKKINIWIFDTPLQIRYRICILLDNLHEILYSIIKLIQKEHVPLFIENNCVEVLTILLESEKFNVEILNKWSDLAFTKGSNELVTLFVSYGSTFGSTNPFLLKRLIIPTDINFDGRVLAKTEESFEFFGKCATAISCLPISKWALAENKNEIEPIYFEIYIAEIKEAAEISIGIISLNHHASNKMIGLTNFSSGCQSNGRKYDTKNEISNSELLMKCWEAGDTIGCVFDPTSEMILFTMNGNPVGEPSAMYTSMQNNSPVNADDLIPSYHASISAVGENMISQYSIQKQSAAESLNKFKDRTSIIATELLKLKKKKTTAKKNSNLLRFKTIWLKENIKLEKLKNYLTDSLDLKEEDTNPLFLEELILIKQLFHDGQRDQCIHRKNQLTDLLNTATKEYEIQVNSLIKDIHTASKNVNKTIELDHWIKTDDGCITTATALKCKDELINELVEKKYLNMTHYFQSQQEILQEELKELQKKQKSILNENEIFLWLKLRDEYLSETDNTKNLFFDRLALNFNWIKRDLLMELDDGFEKLSHLKLKLKCLSEQFKINLEKNFRSTMEIVKKVDEVFETNELKQKNLEVSLKKSENLHYLVKTWKKEKIKQILFNEEIKKKNTEKLNLIQANIDLMLKKEKNLKLNLIQDFNQRKKLEEEKKLKLKADMQNFEMEEKIRRAPYQMERIHFRQLELEKKNQLIYEKQCEESKRIKLIESNLEKLRRTVQVEIESDWNRILQETESLKNSKLKQESTHPNTFSPIGLSDEKIFSDPRMKLMDALHNRGLLSNQYAKSKLYSLQLPTPSHLKTNFMID
ncbi:hypothetical protein HK099_001266 [Clydaea vesicula]|uniref:B30.2/SPRY domain-containing protein n=1 Tax=Clydaea vesicula TaxID=447962 RepID=A0AAD5U6T7_9FUNG|nr:hypothetical protein HK099_001266 [Clydaea vesicula]